MKILTNRDYEDLINDINYYRSESDKYFNRTRKLESEYWGALKIIDNQDETISKLNKKLAVAYARIGGLSKNRKKK